MEKVLVESLTNGDRQTQVEAAKLVSKLSSKQRYKLAERGVITPLVSMLYVEDHDAIEAALSALLSLAFGSERNKTQIVNLGAFPAMLNLLQCQSQTLVEITISAMLTLSSCKTNKPAIASSGVVEILDKFLSGHDACRTSVQGKLDAIATLHNLTTCQESIPFIICSGVLFSLLELARDSEKPPALIEKTMELLEDTACLSELALNQIANAAGALHVLVEVIEERSLPSKEHAVGILLLICQTSREKYRGLLLREGIMPGLLQLSVDGSMRAKKMSKQLLSLLRDCSKYSSASKHKNYEQVQQIMQEIDSGGEKLSGMTMKMVEDMIATLRV